MAINLASKYSDKIVAAYYANSFISNANINNEYDFAGVKSVTIYTPTTVDLGNYNRAATSNRFGTPTEMQDTIQELTLSQDKGYSITIDRGNNEDQMLTKEAGKMMSIQTREKVVPMMDKYTLGQWITNAGTTKQVTPSKENIVDLIFTAATQLDNDLVNADGRVMYITASNYNFLRTSSEFLAVDNLAIKALSRGMVGEIADMKVIKVPDSYLTGAHFLITQKQAVLRPVKIKQARILKDVPGLDGALLEARYYYDAFVLDTLNKGVYAGTTAGTTAG